MSEFYSACFSLKSIFMPKSHEQYKYSRRDVHHDRPGPSCEVGSAIKTLKVTVLYDHNRSDLVIRRRKANRRLSEILVLLDSHVYMQ